MNTTNKCYKSMNKQNHCAYLSWKWYGDDQHRKTQNPNFIHFYACVIFFQGSFQLDQGSVLNAEAVVGLLNPRVTSQTPAHRGGLNCLFSNAITCSLVITQLNDILSYMLKVVLNIATVHLHGTEKTPFYIVFLNSILFSRWAFIGLKKLF